MNQRTRVAAYGLVKNNNRVLLCRLSAQVPHSPGQWTLPGGGLDFGEKPDDAVVREVYEETGLRVDVGAVNVVDSKSVEYNGEQLHSIRLIYDTLYCGGELRYEENGTTDKCAWFTESEVLNLPLHDLAKIGVQIVFA